MDSSLRVRTDEEKSKQRVMASITKTGGALRWALDHHQSDREVVMAAVRRSGLALAFVSDRLQLDVEVAMTAVRQDGKALYFGEMPPPPRQRAFVR